MYAGPPSQISEEEWERELEDREIWSRQPWNPEQEPEEDPIVIEKALAAIPKIQTKLKPSQFTSFAFRMPNTETGDYESFSFEGRRHLKRPYDTPARRVLMICARQVEKCCCTESMILMWDGSWKRAGDVLVGDEVSGLSGDGVTITPGCVTWVSPTRRKFSYKLTTRQGHELIVAGTHPIRVWDGWKGANDVEVGDRIASVRRTSTFSRLEGSPVPGAWVRLCAYFVADGGVGSGYVSFTQKPGPVLDEFRSLLRGEFTANVCEYDRRTSKMLRLSSCSGIKARLVEDGTWGKKSGTKELPPWVYDLSPDDTGVLLNRLWACDGHVKKNSRSKYSIEYCSMSYVLVRQIQSLLWKLGIPSKIRKNWPNIYKRRGEKKFSYILRVETKQGVYFFLRDVGALGKSEDIPLPDLDLPERNNRDTLPPESRTLFESALPPGRSLRSLGLGRFPPRGVTRDRLRTWVSTLKEAGSTPEQVESLERWVHSDVYWDEVVSVERVGTKPCVDFTVSGTSSFVCDGVITHNSTLLGNKSLCYSCLVPAFKTLYVSPSATQTKTFSNDRLKDPIETSPILKRFTTQMLSANILEKQFINRSKVTLRYAFLNADRARGIPAWMLLIDELQDILGDNIPVIEQCLSHAPDKWRRYVYSGTPKSLDNIIETYRANRSTQGEWVVPCSSCGTEKGPTRGRFWNILGEKNIGKRGLICEKCGTLIDPMHQDAQWAFQVAMNPPDVEWESYRIPQLMVPWVPWSEILYRYAHDSRDKFYNETLGISFDSGLRPLTQGQVKACCRPNILMSKAKEKYRELSYSQPFYMGIDWGTGENSYTVVTLATYIDMKFRVFWWHRFTGEGTNPDVQLEKICELVEFFNVRIIGADYGGGFDRNDKLMRKYGPQRLHKFQYAGRPHKKVEWSGKLRRWVVHRTEVMSDIFNAIKRGRECEFPRWEEFKEPFAQDMLNIFSEYSEMQKMIVYKHSLDKPDDSFHSLLYCWLGSMLIKPRPDIITPHKEDPDTGMQIDPYAPVDQGSY
jgi:intein/homing endonuclease